MDCIDDSNIQYGRYVICGGNMKKSNIKVVIALFAVVLLSLCIWFFVPTTFLKNIDVKEVKEIEVFSGSTGVKFVIEDEDEIEYIVENIQNTTMKKEKLSVGYMGYSFLLKFKDENGNILSSFILNGESTIRKDPFFYKTKDGELRIEYITELHDKHATDGRNE